MNDNWTYTADLTPLTQNLRADARALLVFYGLDTIVNIVRPVTSPPPDSHWIDDTLCSLLDRRRPSGCMGQQSIPAVRLRRHGYHPQTGEQQYKHHGGLRVSLDLWAKRYFSARR